MSKTFYKIGDVSREMEKIAERVIEKAAKEILKDFQNDYIRKYVYDSHPPPTRYNNPDEKGKFINTWEWTQLSKTANSISKTMFHNWSKMNNQSNMWQLFTWNEDKYVGIHGSEGFEGWEEDERPYMQEILNKKRASSLQNQSGDFLSPYRAVGYWDEFIRDYVEGGKLKSLIDKIAKSEGLVLK